ncbi:hypothetical protein COK_2078 [Mannheimia haemolytica serotype A2 str. BOVINE]|nr:hypothetical protein COK_2078 [Mannheimia haemolytica serotype A2 str. BOVINE]
MWLIIVPPIFFLYSTRFNHECKRSILQKNLQNRPLVDEKSKRLRYNLCRLFSR